MDAKFPFGLTFDDVLLEPRASAVLPSESVLETKLSDLLKTAKNKGEIIVTFLALLELIKQRIFVADQEALFADVLIRKKEPSEDK